MWFNNFNVCITEDVARFTTKKYHFLFSWIETTFYLVQPMIPQPENSHLCLFWFVIMFKSSASKEDKTLNVIKRHLIYVHQKQNGV